MAVATYSKTGTKATKAATLPKSIFAEEVKNHALIKEAYTSYLAAGRTNNATTKDRSEVRGGGKKPWKQKGTGRARHGSIRSPIWRGGGITFGPRGIENYKKLINKKARNKAIRQALTLKAKDSQVAVIEDFESKEGKVKPTVALLNKIEAKGRTLIVVSENDKFIDMATRNIQRVKAVGVSGVNIFDVTNADLVLISAKSLPLLEKRLIGSKK